MAGFRTNLTKNRSLMMTPLEIDDCRVVFGPEGFAELDAMLADGRKVFSQIVVLCDENTHEHCLPVLAENVPSLVKYEILEIPAGEEYKNLDTCRRIWEALCDFRADRRTLLINLGGGVVTDMGGFAASCYMRGIPFVNIPTTLLAQVDASVGGKTGVDLNGIKNIVGVFSLARLVVVNSLFLTSLPQGEVLSGFAEMLKHGLIRSRTHWEELSGAKDFSLEKTARLVYDSVKIKYDVVREDPTEKGLRKILNFGHTVGHAVETYFMDTPAPISHGHAVAVGMVCESWLSSRAGALDEKFAPALREYVKGLYGDTPVPREAIGQILETMRHDKKNTGKGINFTLLEQIGRASIDHYIDEELIRQSILFYNSAATAESESARNTK